MESRVRGAAVCLRAGGVLTAGFFVLHLLFARIFNWSEALRPLAAATRSVVVILNQDLAAVFLLFAYLSLVHARELLATRAGRALVAGIGACYGLRAAQQIAFFGLAAPRSWAVFLLCLLAGALYLAAAFFSRVAKPTSS